MKQEDKTERQLDSFAGELDKLKDILLSDERARISQLERRNMDISKQVKGVSDVIAEAVVLRSSKDDMLAKAFEPIVSKAINDSVRKKPQDFVTILFPLIGSTIRRSVSETFSGMLGNFSKSIELAFTPKGLKWRIEAIRSGKPFSEVVMLHTMVYMVEQVFLIHKETGLVLSHVSAPNIEVNDADLVSGMLTAIQDFARDSFGGGNGSLDFLKMDEHNIFIEQGPGVYLACVVRGMPPAGFSQKLRENLELATVEVWTFIDSFQGDTTPFNVAIPYLENCLDSKFIDDDKKLSTGMKALPIVILAILLGIIGLKMYRTYKIREALAVLNREPGILIMGEHSYLGFRPWDIVCLKDPLAPEPEDVLAGNGYNNAWFNIKSVPFLFYSPDIVKQRVLNEIKLPPTVDMTVNDGVISFNGVADMGWILNAERIALMTPGVSKVDTSGVRDVRFDRLKELVNSVEEVVVRFPSYSAEPIDEDKAALDNAIAELAELEKLAKTMGIAVSLTVYGHADSVGTDIANYEISQNRAKTIAAMLYAHKSRIPVTMYGMGAEYAEVGAFDSLDSRRVELRVNLLRAAEVEEFILD